jgi:hypothetical protein
MQCRAELLARLVQACGPPAAQNTGRIIIRLLLQMLMAWHGCGADQYRFGTCLCM